MKKRRWTEDDLRTAVRSSRSIRQTIYKLGLVPAGGNYAQVQKFIQGFGIDVSHLKGYAWNKGMTGTYKPGRVLEHVLVDGSYVQSFTLKRRLIASGLKPAFCEDCGWSRRTDDGYLPLEIHHVNGKPRDNRLENLQILCPNCHFVEAVLPG